MFDTEALIASCVLHIQQSTSRDQMLERLLDVIRRVLEEQSISSSAFATLTRTESPTSRCEAESPYCNSTMIDETPISGFLTQEDSCLATSRSPPTNCEPASENPSTDLIGDFEPAQTVSLRDLQLKLRRSCAESRNYHSLAASNDIVSNPTSGLASHLPKA